MLVKNSGDKMEEEIITKQLSYFIMTKIKNNILISNL
jgi:hypothetical protein